MSKEERHQKAQKFRNELSCSAGINASLMEITAKLQHVNKICLSAETPEAKVIAENDLAALFSRLRYKIVELLSKTQYCTPQTYDNFQKMLNVLSFCADETVSNKAHSYAVKNKLKYTKQFVTAE